MNEQKQTNTRPCEEMKRFSEKQYVTDPTMVGFRISL